MESGLSRIIPVMPRRQVIQHCGVVTSVFTNLYSTRTTPQRLLYPQHHKGLVQSTARNNSMANITESSAKKLFTPGPLGVTSTVKKAMLRDVGSRDVDFINTVRDIRHTLLEIAGLDHKKQAYTAVLMQGSGTFSVESVFQTSVPRSGGKVLIFSGGSYGDRLAKICDTLSIEYDIIRNDEFTCLDLEKAKQAMSKGSYTNVAVVHCETSSGIINPVQELGKLVRKLQPGAHYIVDAMSSFGAVALDIDSSAIDFLVSSANKCLEGVPGFGLVITHLDSLLKCKGNSRSLSLDLYDQHENMEKTGMFRFTPPTHTILAFKQALDEFKSEGGVKARGDRYKANREVLRRGMEKLGFEEYVKDPSVGYIITSFLYPKHKQFNFTNFYERLSEKGQVIYPGKLMKADCFRIGTIGQIYPDDVRHLLNCIEQVCNEMEVPLPIS